jgi:hypothetical protein
MEIQYGSQQRVSAARNNFSSARSVLWASSCATNIFWESLLPEDLWKQSKAI